MCKTEIKCFTLGPFKAYSLSFSIFIPTYPKNTFKKKLISQRAKVSKMALAGWLSWLERHPIHQKAAGLNSGWGACGRQPISISLSLPPLTLGLMDMSLSDDFNNKKY